MAKRNAQGQFVSTGKKKASSSSAARGFGVAISHRQLMREARKIQGALRKLGKESRQRKVVRQALGPATTPMNKAAKRRAPEGPTGQYQKSIGKKNQSYPASGSEIIVIGPRVGYKIVTPDGRLHNPSNIGHLLEFGHGGPRPAPAKPHLYPAFESHKNSARRIFIARFWQRFRKEAARVRAKGG